MKREQLYGAWRLVGVEHHLPDGTVTHPRGHDAQGMIVYDPSGYMSVQVMDPHRPKLNAAGDTTAQAAALRAVIEGFTAYCGPYDVDEAEESVVHHLDCATVPEWVGSQRKRYCRFEGNRLILQAEPVIVDGREEIGYITWERLPGRWS